MKNILTAALRVFISLGAIALILYFMRDKIDEAWHILHTDVSWNWFYLAGATFILANILIGTRLFFTFKVQQIHLSLLEANYLAFLGLFFNLFLPSAVGGDVAKAYFAAKYTGKKIESMSAILQDRLVGFFVLMMMGLGAILIMRHEITDARIHWLVYGFVSLMLLCVFFFSSRRFARLFSFAKFLIPSEKLREKLSEIYHSMYVFKKHPSLMVIVISISIIAQVGFITVHYLMALALGAEINFWVFFLLIPVVAIVSMAPSIGGLGVREMGLIFFLQYYMPAERALVLSLLVDMLIYGVSLISGLIYAIKGGLKAKIIDELDGKAIKSA